jgi:hypothetical protein
VPEPLLIEAWAIINNKSIHKDSCNARDLRGRFKRKALRSRDDRRSRMLDMRIIDWCETALILKVRGHDKIDDQ